MQVYRDLVIGTARPTQEEMAGVPHHMMGVADPRENYSVARYVQEATACVEDIFRRGRQPIVVGGTGLYLDALCQGRSFSDFRPETGVRTRLQAQAAQGGLDALWEQLRQVDPEAAARLHPHDAKRIIRALEVWYDTGQTISQHNRQTQTQPPRYQGGDHRPDLPGPPGPLPAHRPAGGPDDGPGAGGGSPRPIGRGDSPDKHGHAGHRL